MTCKISACESLYVWGYNGRNELGLPDDTISANKSDYLKSAMTKPLKNSMFDGLTYQAALGNVSSLFLCADKETKDTFLVTCGVNFCLKDDVAVTDQNEFNHDEVNKMLEEIPSIPFMVQFNLPVV